MTLPCCGTNGREGTSTMRFCAACLLQLTIVPSRSDEYQCHYIHELEPPVRLFYSNYLQADTRRTIQCPRCKDILVVDVKNPVRRMNLDWTYPTNADSISLLRPTFKAKCWHVGRKIGIAVILWRAAFLNHSLMPLEALLGKTSKEADVFRIVKWGILRKTADAGIFQMKKKDHYKLKNILGFSPHGRRHKMRYDPLATDILMGIADACTTQLIRFHPFYAIRMEARFLHLLVNYWSMKRDLSPCSNSAEMKLTAVIIFSSATCVFFIGMPALQLAASFIIGTASLSYSALAMVFEFICMISKLILSVPPATFAFGFICVLMGFMLGQTHPTLTVNDCLSIVSKHSTSFATRLENMIAEHGRQIERIIEQCRWQVDLLEIVKSLFDLLTTQLAVEMIEARLK